MTLPNSDGQVSRFPESGDAPRDPESTNVVDLSGWMLGEVGDCALERRAGDESFALSQADATDEAALTSVRRLLTAWEIEAHRYPQHDVYWIAMWRKDLRPACCYEGRGETLDQALLTAVLQALAASEAPMRRDD